MSYILDALKKSDQERKQESPPNLHTVHGYPPSFKDSSPYIQPVKFLLFTLLSVLFVGLGVYFFQQTEKPPSSPPTVTVKEEPPPPQPAIATKEVPEPPPPAITAREAPSSTAEDEAPPEETVFQEIPPEDTIPEESVKMIDNPPETRMEISSSPVRISRVGRKILLTTTTDSPANKPLTPAKPSEPPSPLPLVKDLPANLRSQVPKFHFAGHTYSEDPAQRMIIINNTITREGDRIDLNTRLVEISWEGVVIDYKGIKFRVDTN